MWHGGFEAQKEADAIAAKIRALRAREKDALPPADRERLAELLREFETVTGDAFDAAPAPPSR